MKYRLLNGWGLFRIIRLAAGAAIAVQGLLNADWLFIIAGTVFTALALLNIGCCAGGACGYPSAVSKKKIEQITYEEVV